MVPSDSGYFRGGGDYDRLFAVCAWYGLGAMQSRDSGDLEATNSKCLGDGKHDLFPRASVILIIKGQRAPLLLSKAD